MSTVYLIYLKLKQNTQKTIYNKNLNLNISPGYDSTAPVGWCLQYIWNLFTLTLLFSSLFVCYYFFFSCIDLNLKKKHKKKSSGRFCTENVCLRVFISWIIVKIFKANIELLMAWKMTEERKNWHIKNHFEKGYKIFVNGKFKEKI